MKLSFPLFLGSFGFLAAALLPGQKQAAPVKTLEFDRDVMPILSQRCYKCHGPDAAKAAAGLRLDSLETAQKAGAIIPGKPGSSRIIARVSEKDPESRMPPPDSGVKPLTKAEIQILETWIKSGAKYEKHWSYVPPVMPTMPKVSDPAWAKNPIDLFVLSKLDAAGMKPEPEADRRTLAMRAAQALTGLPPSPEASQAFFEDSKSGAYERFVDRLLASPAYGEHQARYWLDAVRYGDTHGLQLDNERGVYPYRDWVVRAFNQDLPYTKFVEWQLAGDMLPNPTNEQLVATGFIRMNLTSNEGGAIEEEFLARNTFDRVETVGTTLLGLTVQCARCHDHKYDPISQKDYYGMYAFFNSTKDNPLDGNITYPPPVVKAPSPEQSEELNRIDKGVSDILSGLDLGQVLQYMQGREKPMPSGHDWKISPVYAHGSFDEAFDFVDPAEKSLAQDGLWKPFNLEIGKDYPNIIRRDNAAVYVRGKVTMESAASITFGISSDDAVKVWLNGKLIHSHKVGRGLSTEIDSVKADFLAGENDLLIKVINGISFDGLNLRLYDVNDKRIHDVVAEYRKSPSAPDAIRNLKVAYLELGSMESKAGGAYRKLVDARSKLDNEIPMTLIAQEMEKPRATYILKRGVYDQKGELVKRHFPAAFGSGPPGLPMNRLGLARWMTASTNPLVSRVFVNRIWQQNLGTGLVKTAEDFGSQGEWPVNSALLDYLAVSFQQKGWSVKALNRMIVTSATFRQSSKITAKKLASDPENRLNSRGPRYRLDAEVIRDKALWASGLLLSTSGGKGFKPYQPDGIWENASDPASATHFYVRDHGVGIYRRSMYLFWKRTAPPPAMVALDSPLRDTCVVRRSTTNTPLQALVLQNEPAFLEASRVMAQRILNDSGTDSQRINRAYALISGRYPTSDESSILIRALTAFRSTYSKDLVAAKSVVKVGDAPLDASIDPVEQAAWMLLCSTLMNTDEFLTLH